MYIRTKMLKIFLRKFLKIFSVKHSLSFNVNIYNIYMYELVLLSECTVKFSKTNIQCEYPL